VSGERLSNGHWGFGPGKAESRDDPQVRRPAMREGNANAVGCDGKERNMNALNQTAAKTSTGLMSILFVALIGATVMFVAGHAQSATLHDAAHDMRHATGFPCH
jgi:cobalt transporter subunit CbtB